MCEPKLSIDGMLAEHLDTEEILYELLIRRPTYESIDQPVANESSADKLQRWLERDRAASRPLHEWTVVYTEDEASEEIDKSKNVVSEIRKRVRTAVRGSDALILVQLQSRLIHRFWRMRRITADDFSANIVHHRSELKGVIKSVLEDVQESLDQLADPNTSTAENPTKSVPDGMLNSTQHPADTPPPPPTDPDLGYRLARMVQLEARYAPTYNDVRAWSTNGKATDTDLRMANQYLDIVVNEWHELNRTAGNAEVELLGRLTAMMRDIIQQRQWLNAELQRRSTSTTTSTLPPVNGTTPPEMYQQSYNAYATGVDALNFDESMQSAFPAMSTVNPAGVQFGTNSVHHLANQSVQSGVSVADPLNKTTTIPQAQTAPTQARSGPVPQAQSNRESRASDNVSTAPERTQLWPPMDPNSTQRADRQSYHPSIVNRSMSDRNEPPRFSVSQNSGNGTTSNSTMQPWQIQQQMAKYFLNRKYDGLTSDGSKTLGTSEFLGRLRSMRNGMNITDETVLSLLDMFVTGLAWDWWSTRKYNIHTLDELEEQMNIRFEQQKMDMWSQRVAFASRKQGVDEYIADYIDEMCRRAHGMRPRMDESEIIQVIIDNANLKCQAQLLNRGYTSLQTLRQHADFLGTRLLKVTKNERKMVPKRYIYKPNSVQAIETEGDWIELEVIEDGDSPSNEHEPQGFVEVDAVGQSNRSSRIMRVKRDIIRPKAEVKSVVTSPTVEQSTESNTVMFAPVGGVAESMEIRCFGCDTPGVMQRNCLKCASSQARATNEFKCYGCGAPGVMRRNCEKCNAHDSKNGIASL